MVRGIESEAFESDLKSVSKGEIAMVFLRELGLDQGERKGENVQK